MNHSRKAGSSGRHFDGASLVGNSCFSALPYYAGTSGDTKRQQQMSTCVPAGDFFIPTLARWNSP